MHRKILMITGVAAILACTMPAFAQEEVQYKKFKFDDVSCDAGIRYKQTEDGMTIGVSAIAYGKGAEFRKWNVESVKLSIAGERFRPDSTKKFYVKKESLFRVPAAVVFAILGAQVDYGGSDLEKGITKAGMAVGLGLLVLQAHGEITGNGCVFNIGEELKEKIMDGRDFIEITVNNDDLHKKEMMKIGITKTFGAVPAAAEFSHMNKAELKEFIDMKEDEVSGLEKEQGSYRYGVDAEYDNIQRKIELIQTERGIAYKLWFEKEN